MTYFGTNIKKIRQIKGLSQQAFADLLDLTRGIISSYEEGRAEPKIETLLHIAHFFNLSTDELISKPLTVNQLANFSDLEDLLVKPKATINNDKIIKQINEKGEFESVDLQKILAKIEFVYILKKNLEGSVYKKNDVLFLVEAKANQTGEFIYFENDKVFYSDNFLEKKQIYQIVGYLGQKAKSHMNDILLRLEKLENALKII